MDNKNQKKLKEEQLNIPLDVKKDNSISFFKHSLDKKVRTVSVTPYWRSFYYVLAFVFSWITFLFLSITLYLNYSKIPDQVPMIYSQALVGWDLVNKDMLLLVLAVLFVFNCLSPLINSKIYNFDKRLVLVSCIVLIIVDCLLLIAMNELFFLLLR
jgi:hypothetical protein